MSLKIITVGDKTDHGGKVISGSANHDIRGKAIARLGDKVDCPLLYPGGKPHGINKIITSHNTLTVDGVPVAVDGCKTECGCKLIGSAPVWIEAYGAFSNSLTQQKQNGTIPGLYGRLRREY